MHETTKAVVISKIRYKEKDLIVKCYTASFGLKSFLLKGIFSASKKKLIKPAYFQFLTQLKVTANFKTDKSLLFLKEVQLTGTQYEIQNSIVKTSQAVFISEVLNTILNEDYHDLELFNFIEETCRHLSNKTVDPNLHLIFLIKLTSYLGFSPDANNNNLPFFNLKEGRFQNHDENPYCISGRKLTLFKSLLGTNFDAKEKLCNNTEEKRVLMNMILLYFKLHLDGFKEPKSLEVLQQVFS